MAEFTSVSRVPSNKGQGIPYGAMHLRGWHPEGIGVLHPLGKTCGHFDDLVLLAHSQVVF